VGEYIASLMLVSIFKIVLVLFVSSLLAYIFYSFNLFIIGISLIPFVANLIILGWAIGIITTALILRFGQQAEVLAWGIAFLFQPISAVFYPVSVLPAWLQSVARFVPSSYVFEGMRSVIIYHKFDGSALLVAFILNLVYLTISLAFFFYMFRIVRDKGLLSRMGE
jgi:ABC-2 type transport system permease protein